MLQLQCMPLQCRHVCHAVSTELPRQCAFNADCSLSSLCHTLTLFLESNLRLQISFFQLWALRHLLQCPLHFSILLDLLPSRFRHRALRPSANHCQCQTLLHHAHRLHPPIANHRQCRALRHRVRRLPPHIGNHLQCRALHRRVRRLPRSRYMLFNLLHHRSLRWQLQC